MLKFRPRTTDTTRRRGAAAVRRTARRGMMTATLAAVLGLTLAQPPAPAPDYYPLTGRTITLPVEYKGDRKGIGQVQLYASADKGQTWPLVATVLPDKTEFSYTSPKDGTYWFHIVIVDRAGK